jgi:hypothetical protein
MFDTYLREIRDSLGHLATWLPSEPLAVGSVGMLDGDGRFHEETTLERLGIPLEVVHGRSQAQITYRSSDGTSVDFKAAGRAPAEHSALTVEEAGFVVALSRKHAIVFEAVGCQHEKLKDVDDVGNQIIDRVDARLWKARYVVITGIVRARSATVLISSGSEGKFEATIGGAVSGGAMSIGDARLGLTARHSRSLGIEICAQTDLTPLYSAYRARKGWWRAGRWEPTRSVFDGPLEEVTVEDVLAPPGAPGSGSAGS